MAKSVVERLADTTPIVPAWGQPKITKCSWCKTRFERYDDKWVYHFSKCGRDYWQCSWKHHRLEGQRLYPKKELRGERCVENMQKYWREHDDRNKEAKML